MSVPIRAMTRSPETGLAGPGMEVSPEMTRIVQAKDRAQITAATSMSIVHVALLKSVLDSRHTDNPQRYFTALLSLIIAALILQVIAGLFAIYLALLRNYYTRYQDDILRDIRKVCCPYDCRKRDYDSSDLREWLTVSPDDDGAELVLPKTKTPKPGCCPWHCSPNNSKDLEDRIINLYRLHQEELIRYDVMNAELGEHGELGEGERHEENTDESEKRKKIQLRYERLKAQSEKLGQYAEGIEKERVLKRATFFQDVLTIICYMVFVMNAFIAGFGLSSTGNTSGPVNNTTSTA